MLFWQVGQPAEEGESCYPHLQVTFDLLWVTVSLISAPAAQVILREETLLECHFAHGPVAQYSRYEVRVVVAEFIEETYN